MCGRFTLRTPAKDLAEILRLADIPDLRPRYNIAPTEPVVAVRANPKNGHRGLVTLHWGLIPFGPTTQKSANACQGSPTSEGPKSRGLSLRRSYVG